MVFTGVRRIRVLVSLIKRIYPQQWELVLNDIDNINMQNSLGSNSGVDWELLRSIPGNSKTIAATSLDPRVGIAGPDTSYTPPPQKKKRNSLTLEFFICNILFYITWPLPSLVETSMWSTIMVIGSSHCFPDLEGYRGYGIHFDDQSS